MRCSHGHTSINGKNKSSTYVSWDNAKARCYRVGNRQYAVYGGRGIKICERWLHNFEAFLADMGEKPDGMTLDRIDVNGDYCPENCRWASWHVQRVNQRRTVYHEFEGKKYTLQKLAKLLGIKSSTLAKRMRCGVSLTKPLRRARTFRFGNERLTMEEVVQRTGIQRQTLEKRLRNGKPLLSGRIQPKT